MVTFLELVDSFDGHDRMFHANLFGKMSRLGHYNILWRLKYPLSRIKKRSETNHAAKNFRLVHRPWNLYSYQQWKGEGKGGGEVEPRTSSVKVSLASSVVSCDNNNCGWGTMKWENDNSCPSQNSANQPTDKQFHIESRTWASRGPESSRNN